MANREKLQPRRKITKKGYSPKERKERAGNGTELLVGLGAGTASSPSMSPWSSALTSPREALTSGRDLRPAPALRSCASFSTTPKRRDALNIYGHTHTQLVGSPEWMCSGWSTRASLEKASGSPSWVDSSDPHGAAAHLEMSRSNLSSK